SMVPNHSRPDGSIQASFKRFFGYSASRRVKISKALPSGLNRATAPGKPTRKLSWRSGSTKLILAGPGQLLFSSAAGWKRWICSPKISTNQTASSVGDQKGPSPRLALSGQTHSTPSRERMKRLHEGGGLLQNRLCVVAWAVNGRSNTETGRAGFAIIRHLFRGDAADGKDRDVR